MERQMAVVSFTPGGELQGKRIAEYFLRTGEGQTWKVEHIHKPANLKLWCKKQFETKDAILFIGAMGIAVRTIAPCLASKLSDPAVLVMDEHGRHVISVLSGHIGRGNELTCVLAEGLGAEPIITTASDVNHKIAIDVWASKNQLVITDMKQARKAAAAIVAGKQVHFSCDGRILGEVPEELCGRYPEAEFYVKVTEEIRESAENVLYLMPKTYMLGVGCRKGKTMGEIEARVQEELKAFGISMERILGVASIDLKKEEQGLLEFCKKYKLPITFYTPEELERVEGEFQSSSFVKSVAGVDNVCERAAIKGIEKENPRIVLEKRGKDGVTIALAKRDWSVEFE